MALLPSPAHPSAHARAGFTLVELLIVVVVIGILALISVQGLEAFRTRALDAAVKSDLRNALVAEEAHFSENGEYVAFSVSGGGSAAELEFTASSQVDVAATRVGKFVRIEGKHAASDNEWCVSSSDGVVVAGTGC